MMLHVFDYWDRSGFWMHPGWLPDGARAAEGADAACRIDHHRRGGAGHGADFESGAHAEADDQRASWSIWIVEVWREALCRHSENVVRTAAEGAQRGASGAGNRYRRSAQESPAFEICGLRQGSPC